MRYATPAEESKLHARVLKSVDVYGVIGDLPCRVALSARERAVSGYWYLTGSRFSKQ
jgi:hypothetical protein